jgi:hypothetical protein
MSAGDGAFSRICGLADPATFDPAVLSLDLFRFFLVSMVGVLLSSWISRFVFLCFFSGCSRLPTSS